MNRLRQLRKEAGLSSNLVGQAIGLTERSVLRYENETQNMNANIIRAFANFYNVSADYILCLSDFKNSSNVNISIDDKMDIFYQNTPLYDIRMLFFILHFYKMLPVTKDQFSHKINMHISFFKEVFNSSISGNLAYDVQDSLNSLSKKRIKLLVKDKNVFSEFFGSSLISNYHIDLDSQNVEIEISNNIYNYINTISETTFILDSSDLFSESNSFIFSLIEKNKVNLSYKEFKSLCSYSLMDKCKKSNKNFHISSEDDNVLNNFDLQVFLSLLCKMPAIKYVYDSIRGHVKIKPILNDFSFDEEKNTFSLSSFNINTTDIFIILEEDEFKYF
ncbi:helix-turn-helix domain-containing protein [Clostridioides sp. GD02377]|uniref:helix-turn-helix domain-containing protein n=1 Tax=unclassified Clostridioides TaxID=2635829 RepID=UPI0038A23083